MTTLALAAYLLLQGLPQPFPAPMERRLVHIESRGNPQATSRKGCVGLWQVAPKSACSRLWTAAHKPASKARIAFCDQWAAALADVWRAPVVGTLGGRAVLRRYLARCGRKRGARSQLRCALRAYACGNRALRDERACGRYAAAVMAAGGGK